MKTEQEEWGEEKNLTSKQDEWSAKQHGAGRVREKEIEGSLEERYSSVLSAIS